MPRGTKKSYFKRKNTRNNKKIRKQRRTRKRKGGFLCGSLSLGSKSDQKIKNALKRIGKCQNDTDKIEDEWIKIYLADKNLRKRGWGTWMFKRKHTERESKEANENWDDAVKRKKERENQQNIQMNRRLAAKAAARRAAKAKQKKTDAESVKQMVAPSSTLHRSRSSSPRRSSISSSASPDDESNRYYKHDHEITY